MALSYAYSGEEGFISAVEGRLADAGFTRVPDAAAADVVLSFCATQSALEDLYFGDAGFVQEAAPNTLLIDLSATTPGFAREINAVATVSDLAMVEAPLVVEDVVAADSFARENLACFVAGEDDDVVRAKPVLEALFATVHETGGSGTAQLARAGYTLQVAAQIIAAIEAQALYRAVRRSASSAGVGAVSVGAASAQAERVLRAVDEGRFEGAYNVEMLMAELTAAIMAADDAELILPQAEAAMHLLELLAVIGGADKSPTALSLIYGEESECAKHGLDWTRAEEAYGGKVDAFDDDGCDDYDDGCGCDHEHHYDDYDGYDMDDPYGTFSNN